MGSAFFGWLTATGMSVLLIASLTAGGAFGVATNTTVNVDQAVQESEQGTGTEIQAGRPFWKLRPLKIVITLAAVILAGLVAIGLVVSGPLARAVGEAIGLGDTAVTIWGILKWPVLLGLAAVVVVILYYATPNVQQPKFKWISLGAVVAIITWVIASPLGAVRSLRLPVLELQQDLRLSPG